MITDTDKQDKTMELGRNRHQGNSQHSTSRFARIRRYVAILRTDNHANCGIFVSTSISTNYKFEM